MSARKSFLVTEAAVQRDLILRDMVLLRRHGEALQARARTLGAVAMKVGLILGAAATGRRLLSRSPSQPRASKFSSILKMGARWALGVAPYFFNRK